MSLIARFCFSLTKDVHGKTRKNKWENATLVVSYSSHVQFIEKHREKLPISNNIQSTRKIMHVSAKFNNGRFKKKINLKAKKMHFYDRFTHSCSVLLWEPRKQWVKKNSSDIWNLTSEAAHGKKYLKSDQWTCFFLFSTSFISLWMTFIYFDVYDF